MIIVSDCVYLLRSLFPEGASLRVAILDKLDTPSPRYKDLYNLNSAFCLAQCPRGAEHLSLRGSKSTIQRPRMQ